MSYILDALKKSEAERDPRAAAALVIAEAERTQAERQKYRVALWVIGIALLANAAIFGAWLAWWANPQAVTPVHTMPDPRNSAAGPEQSAQIAVTVPGATRLAGDAAADHRPVAIPPIQPPQTSAPAKLVRIRLGELPSSALAGFPGLAFSTHIFADDPELRAVVVNGTRRTEGDLVEGMTLEEITEEGVVLHFGEYLVEISVLESWQDD